MPYTSGTQFGTPYTQPGPTNLWVGNNYAQGNAQASRSPMMPMNPQMNPGMPMSPNQTPPVNNILQVMGPESAQSYQVGPNSHVILMDSNRPVFYMKRSDDSGYSETKAFQFHEIPLMPQQAEPQLEAKEIDYATKDDLDEIKTLCKNLEQAFMEHKKLIEDLVVGHE